MIDQPVFLSPAVIDLVTCAQGIYEGRICGAVLTAPAEVLAILGIWKPEVNQAAKKLWKLIELGHCVDLVDAAIRDGMLWDVTCWLGELSTQTSEDRAKYALDKWECCKAARIGLSIIANDPTVGEIIEKSRYKNGQ